MSRPPVGVSSESARNLSKIGLNSTLACATVGQARTGRYRCALEVWLRAHTQCATSARLWEAASAAAVRGPCAPAHLALRLGAPGPSCGPMPLIAVHRGKRADMVRAHRDGSCDHPAHLTRAAASRGRRAHALRPSRASLSLNRRRPGGAHRRATLLHSNYLTQVSVSTFLSASRARHALRDHAITFTLRALIECASLSLSLPHPRARAPYRPTRIIARHRLERIKQVSPSTSFFEAMSYSYDTKPR